MPTYKLAPVFVFFLFVATARAQTQPPINDARQIKALLDRIFADEQKSEDAGPAAIRTLEKAAAGAAQPARSILQNLIATAYWRYFQDNRYRLYDRTNTVGFKKDDIATWTIADFREKISKEYLASLQEEKILRQTIIEDFEPIVVKGNARYLRPTLFDLLAHTALDYFTTDEEDIDKPANAFELDDTAAFADAAVFAGHHFTTTDSSSLHFYALQLFQRLIRMHLADSRPDALINVDIERLGFAHIYSANENKEQLYTDALIRLTNTWGDNRAAAVAWYLLARRYADKASGYNALNDTAGHYDYIAAKAICERVIREKDSSEGKASCEQLLKEILEKKLELRTEKVNLPGQPFRALISWRNAAKLYCRIILLTDSNALMQDVDADNDAFWKKMVRMPVLRSFAQVLPETGDYQTHGAEIRIDALPVGRYALLASTDTFFSLRQQPVVLEYFNVSRLAYINHIRNYFVVDRESGQPLPNVSVQVRERRSYGVDAQQSKRAETYKTDEHGHFLMKKRDLNQFSLNLELRTDSDRYLSGDLPNGMFFEPADILEKDKYEQVSMKTWFFTDRAIYRPGQQVYFKGIVISRDYETHRPKIIPKMPTKVFLCDANSNRIDSLDLVTNDYGSYHGQFTLPEHLLNGEFFIESVSGNGKQIFSVEEYKRPKFSVGFDQPKASYHPGDSVYMDGYAKAFSGNMIDGALVSYRVVRRVNATFRWDSKRLALRPEDQEIVHGTVKTDGQGRFRIGFVATADRSVDKETQPVFEYAASADVTDISGETHSGESSAKAGYVSLQLAIAEPSDDHLPADSLRTLVVRATDLSAMTTPALVNIAISPLRDPGRLLRERYWPAPDLFVLSREEYLRNFPKDPYGEEDNIIKWQRLDKIFESSDSAGKPTIVAVGGKVLAPGWYVIEVSGKDKDGQVARATRYVELYDSKTGRPAYPQYNWPLPENMTAGSDDPAPVAIGTSAKQVSVIRTVEPLEELEPNKPTNEDRKFSFIRVDDQRQQSEIPNNQFRPGAIGISDIFVKDNRIFKKEHLLIAPGLEKELTITYRSWRDKTLPGSGEKWEIAVKGKGADPVAAEVLAGMYDASLDQFKPHAWSKPSLNPILGYVPDFWYDDAFGETVSQEREIPKKYLAPYTDRYDELMIPFVFRRGRGIYHRSEGVVDFNVAEKVESKFSGYVHAIQLPDSKNDPDGSKGLMVDTLREPIKAPKSEVAVAQQISTRKDFRETAFFFPDLRTDTAGNLSFSFTMPEALTTWKGMILAHTRDLAFGYSEKTIITQKQLMVQPNAPRFLREGDRMELAVKVVNLTDTELTGQMSLQLTDPTTGQTADGWFVNRQPNQYFTVAAKQSAVVSFPLDIPYQYTRPVSYKVVAEAGHYSDGEEATLPVVSNRMLVTESLPLNMRGDGEQHFTFDKLLKSGSSETLNNHGLTVEFTANPAWLAVQALPYLMEYPYDCAEQTFDRFYANALATQIVNGSPRLQRVFETWRTTDTTALLSNLEKNQELKTVLLQETPWVLDAKTEDQRKRNIALLFDLARMSRESQSALDQLSSLQAEDGGFVWFKGGPDDRYMTQYILTGIGRLQQMKAIPAGLTETVNKLVTAALGYLDKQLATAYQRDKTGTTLAVQYLYMRSLFPEKGVPGQVFPAMNYFRKKAQQSWREWGPYLQGMTALALFHTGDGQTARTIMSTLKQNAIRDEEKGMYWKGMTGGYSWYEAPVETEALLIEAFREISGDPVADREMKTWLLRQKQTKSWPTTKATADACYALLNGQSWINTERSVAVRLGDKSIEWPAGSGEAGTGYNKKIFDGPFVNPSMGNITVTMRTPDSSGQTNSSKSNIGSPAWGAVYWQYFDMLDKITPPGSEKSALSLRKQLFIQRNTDRGKVLEPLADNGSLNPGDRVIVRIELRADRDMEYVHLKDMRAACLEPENVISEYKWQDGLGYYESTKDASTEFFFGSLPRGTYVFEYPLLAGQKGNFSNGITSIECLYAPEFSYHTEGIRVNVEAGQ